MLIPLHHGFILYALASGEHRCRSVRHRRSGCGCAVGALYMLRCALVVAKRRYRVFTVQKARSAKSCR
ncbi:hypothetical protein KCP76_10635 [Salmonella enterica subsp. enterica serovar Weltevreden]|nr:hypothetical protein KCP76_10635 [Salmonella enterica subsp. enterica serovar Weltevreden]